MLEQKQYITSALYKEGQGKLYTFPNRVKMSSETANENVAIVEDNSDAAAD